MLILKYIMKLLKALGSEAEPWQLASGFVLGMIMGLTPLLSLHNLLLLILILLLKVNIGMALLGLSIFSGVAYLADPFFDQVGFAVLTMDSLNGLWTTLYDIPAIALTRFYNTVVMGSLLCGVVFAIPLYPATLKFVDLYRKHIHERVQKWKIVKALKSSKIYSIYQNVNKFRGT